MYILGINAYHGDAAAAIIKDGQLIAAVEERDASIGSSMVQVSLLRSPPLPRGRRFVGGSARPHRHLARPLSAPPQENSIPLT